MKIVMSLALAASCAVAAPQSPSREPMSNADAAALGGERGVVAPLNGNDACSAAPAISGLGMWSFDLAGATTDGLSHPQCLAFNSSQIWRDRWWSWTSPVSGVVRVETCDLTTLDTRIAVYAPGSPCPPTNEYVVGCNDDACNSQTAIDFVARAGQTYLVRLGRFGSSEPVASGSGAFRISSAAAPGQCPPGDGPEQLVAIGGAAYGSTVSVRVADDVTAPVTGAIEGLCWFGSYFGFAPAADAFVITYWTDAGGVPGTPIASFSQANGLAVERAATDDLDAVGGTMFRFSAAHAAVPVAKNIRYWIEVRNLFGNTWYWQSSQQGNGALQDTTPSSDWTDAIPRQDMAWRLDLTSGCSSDTNGDGVINFADLNNIVSLINSACP